VIHQNEVQFGPAKSVSEIPGADSLIQPGSLCHAVFIPQPRYSFMVGLNLIALVLAILFLVKSANCEQASSAALTGRVEDVRSGEGLGWSSVWLEEIRQGETSHADGSFHIYRIPSGNYTLRVSRIGYQQFSAAIYLAPGDTLEYKVRLSPSRIELEEVEFQIERGSNDYGSYIHAPLVELSADELQRELGSTIAETLNEKPGIAQRSMGPAPSRPVLRGLSGNRLLILEDGQRTGDLSSTSSDHAVAVEPMTARRIELIRGPEVFLHGSGVMGGVVNVERGIIETGEAHKLSGGISLQSDAVNEGLAGGAWVSGPIGPLTARVDGSLRRGSNMGTPVGDLVNTGIRTENLSLGISLPGELSLLGVGAVWYDSEYGIPGGFVGAHPHGVDISMQRRGIHALGRYHFHSDIFKRLDVEYNFSRYYHAEYESSGALGMEFGVQTHNFRSLLHLGKQLSFVEGVVGIWTEYRDYATGGLSFTPDTGELQAAAFLYEHRHIGDFHLQGALRFDMRAITPDDEYYSIIIGQIEERNFSGASGSLSAEWEWMYTHWLGLTLSSTWRAPGTEELFSGGPHLAAYSYEIGNPLLNAERGLGSELYLRVERARASGRFTIFSNYFKNYIFPAYTGRRSQQRNDLYEYRYEGQDALMSGLEFQGDLELNSVIHLNGSMSYVSGDLVDRDVPLPQMPPLSAKVGIALMINSWRFDAGLTGTAAQNRTYIADDPAALPEDPTAGWSRFDMSIRWQKTMHGVLHSLLFAVENALDKEYRSHLSRVRSVMPEPGRNLKLVYRVYL
jgi:iron complex outermembrane recepter protein